MTILLQYSRNQVKRAGKILRKSLLEPLAYSEEDVAWANNVLSNWRACHSYALTKGTMAQRQRLATKSLDGVVAQRLKRRATIIGKLVRHPNMQLTTMQDLAGCRVVLPGPDAVHRFLTGWGVRDRLVEEYDYAAQPAPSGYRAIHWVVKYPVRKHDFLVEMQVRTEMQHEWAVAVERLGGRLGSDLKSGEGPKEVLDWLAAVAEAFAYLDQGSEAPRELDERIKKLRAYARPYFSEEV